MSKTFVTELLKPLSELVELIPGNGSLKQHMPTVNSSYPSSSATIFLSGHLSSVKYPRNEQSSSSDKMIGADEVQDEDLPPEY